MATPFLGEIKICAFGFAPPGWALCNGQQLPINQNQGLFSLFGTTYGGNGQTTFALPDLRGRMPIHFGNGYVMGERGGSQAHTLTINELPTHTHQLLHSTNAATTDNPAGNAPAATVSPIYGPPQSLTAVSPAAVQNVGGSQAHLNMAPFLTLNFIVAIQGVFPSQN
jgi:microcystin-dependent protein